MKYLILILCFGLLQPANAGDFDTGLAAYKEGDYETAYRLWKSMAEGGDVVAQYNLGVMYNSGQGVDQSDKKAIKWYRMAAEQGDSAAQTILGSMYATGRGVRKNSVQAYAWSSMGAAQGDPAGAKVRDAMAADMTPAQIEEARELIDKWSVKQNRE